MFSDTPQTAQQIDRDDQAWLARRQRRDALKARIAEAKKQANLLTALATDPGHDFLAGLVGDDDSTALHLRDAAQDLCRNITPREADVWAPKNRPVTCHGKPVLRNGRKVWARYLLKPQRTSRKERALLEGDLTRFTAIDDLDRALNAGEITNEQHAHRLNELGSERLTGTTTTHSRHVDVHHETADDTPVLMGDRRSNSLLDAERAQREEVRWLNGFYVTLLAEVEGWGEDPTHPIELSPAKPGARLKVGRHERHDPRVEQLTFENTIPNERIRPYVLTLLRRERVRQADEHGYRAFREAPPEVKVNGVSYETAAVQAKLDAELHEERQLRVDRYLARVGRTRKGERFTQPLDAEGFRVTVPAGEGIACSTARICPAQPAPVLMCDALIEAERNVSLVLAIWRYEGV